MSTSGLLISTKILLYFFQPISSLSFEFCSSETYGCETQGGTYIRTHGPMDFWSLFGLWGPQYPVLCCKSGFKLLRVLIPSIQKSQSEVNFFHLEDRKKLSVLRPRQANAILHIIRYPISLQDIEYICESKKLEWADFILIKNFIDTRQEIKNFIWIFISFNNISH